MSKESMLDQRLFNQEKYTSNFGDDDSYNLYDRPLFQGSSAAAAIYKPMSNANGEDEEDAGTEEGIKRAMQNDRFDLGVASRGFEGAADQEVRILCSSDMLWAELTLLALCSAALVLSNSRKTLVSQILSVLAHFSIKPKLVLREAQREISRVLESVQGVTMMSRINQDSCRSPFCCSLSPCSLLRF